MSKGLLFKVALILALFVSFSACGLLMHHACRDAPKNNLGWTDIAGYDSEGYVTHFTCPVGLMEVNHRHPLIALVTAPVTTVGMMVSYRVGREIGYDAVIVCFALIGALTCWMLWLVMKKSGADVSSRIAAMALWLSFAHVWILAGVAETFNISMMIMLGVLLMVLDEVRDVRVWAGATFLAGGTTVTNFIKPLVTWMIAADGLRFVRRLDKRTIGLAILCSVGAMILVVAALFGKWVFLDGISVGKGIDITVGEVTKFLPKDFSLSRRLWLVWNAFWCEPMMLRESVIGQGAIRQPYPSVFPHILGTAVFALCAWSAIRNFCLPVVRAALAMVVFDILLHVIIGWGVEEGQIYCGHWFWIIPLLIALLTKRTALATCALAVGIAVCNLAVVFGG